MLPRFVTKSPDFWTLPLGKKSTFTQFRFTLHYKNLKFGRKKLQFLENQSNCCTLSPTTVQREFLLLHAFYPSLVVLHVDYERKTKFNYKRRFTSRNVAEAELRLTHLRGKRGQGIKLTILSLKCWLICIALGNFVTQYQMSGVNV